MADKIIVLTLKWNPGTSQFEFLPDEDVNVIIGRLAMTNQYTTDWVTLAHYDKRSGSGSYAIAFDPYGAVYVNGVTGRSVNFCINGSTKVYMDTNMFRLSGIRLNMFGNYIDNINYLIGNATFLRIGASGSSGHGLTADNDLLIAGKSEFDGDAFFDSELQPNGPVVFVGTGAGLSAGSMYGHDISETVAIGDNNPTKISAGLSGGPENNVTFQNNHEMRILKAGFYSVNWSLSLNMAAGSNIEIEGGAMLNGTAVLRGTAHEKLVGGTDTVNISGNLIVDCAVNDLISLFVTNETDTNDVVIEHADAVISQQFGT